MSYGSYYSHIASHDISMGFFRCVNCFQFCLWSIRYRRKCVMLGHLERYFRAISSQHSLQFCGNVPNYNASIYVVAWPHLWSTHWCLQQNVIFWGTIHILHKHIFRLFGSSPLCKHSLCLGKKNVIFRKVKICCALLSSIIGVMLIYVSQHLYLACFFKFRNYFESFLFSLVLSWLQSLPFHS